MAEVPRWLVWIVSDPKRNRNFLIAGYLIALWRLQQLEFRVLPLVGVV